jgi:hypothetical protein
MAMDAIRHFKQHNEYRGQKVNIQLAKSKHTDDNDTSGKVFHKAKKNYAAPRSQQPQRRSRGWVIQRVPIRQVQTRSAQSSPHLQARAAPSRPSPKRTSNTPEIRAYDVFENSKLERLNEHEKLESKAMLDPILDMKRPSYQSFDLNNFLPNGLISTASTAEDPSLSQNSRNTATRSTTSSSFDLTQQSPQVHRFVAEPYKRPSPNEMFIENFEKVATNQALLQQVQLQQQAMQQLIMQLQMAQQPMQLTAFTPVIQFPTHGSQQSIDMSQMQNQQQQSGQNWNLK